MNERKEVLSFMIYMWNRWSMTEAAIVFNGYDNTNTDKWEYSLGHHMWENCYITVRTMELWDLLKEWLQNLIQRILISL